MISFSAPYALLALVALPILVLIHRRRRRAVPIDVPSVLFLEAEALVAAEPERVRIDAGLLLSLAAATLLALAASGLRFTSSSLGRVVRIVVDNGPSMEARSPGGETAGQRAARAWTGIRDLLGPDDRLVALPGHGGAAGLVAAARAEEADLRVVVTDRRIDPALSDCVVVCVGDPSAANVGIVAAHVDASAGAARAFANVLNAGPGTVRVRLSLSIGRNAVAERVLDVGAGSAASATFDLPAGTPERVQFDLEGGDALAEDDDATLVRDPLRIAFASGSQGYPEAYRRAVREGLVAVLGADLLVEVPIDANPSIEIPGSRPDLIVGEPTAVPRGGGIAALSLSPIPPGREGRRIAPAKLRASRFAPEESPIDATGSDLVFASVADHLFESLSGDVRGWRFLPDPLAGSPAPVDQPVWPLFLDGLVTSLRGREVAMGWRLARGLLDTDATRVGRDAIPFDPARLAAVARVRRGRERDPRLLLLAAGSICLGLLWFFPSVRGGPRLP